MFAFLLPSAAVRNFAHRGCRCDDVGGNASFFADPVTTFRSIDAR
jgi:hypothetical protein